MKIFEFLMLVNTRLRKKSTQISLWQPCFFCCIALIYHVMYVGVFLLWVHKSRCYPHEFPCHYLASRTCHMEQSQPLFLQQRGNMFIPSPGSTRRLVMEKGRLCTHHQGSRQIGAHTSVPIQYSPKVKEEYGATR